MAGTPTIHRLSAEFWAIIGSAAAIGLLLYYLVGGLPAELDELRGEFSDMRERIARIEALIEVYVRGEVNDVLRGPSTGQ